MNFGNIYCLIGIFLAFSFCARTQKQYILPCEPSHFYSKYFESDLIYRFIFAGENLNYLFSDDQKNYYDIVKPHDFLQNIAQGKEYNFKGIQNLLNECDCNLLKDYLKELENWYEKNKNSFKYQGFTSLSDENEINQIIQNINDQVYDEQFKQHFLAWMKKTRMLSDFKGRIYEEGFTGLIEYPNPYLKDKELYEVKRFDHVNNFSRKVNRSIFKSDPQNHSNTLTKRLFNSQFVFFKDSIISQFQDRLNREYYNFNGRKIMSDIDNKKYYHKNGKVSFSKSYSNGNDNFSKIVKIAYDSLGNISYKNGDGIIYNYIDEDEYACIFNHTHFYKSFKLVKIKTYFEDFLLSETEYDDNEQPLKTNKYHWKTKQIYEINSPTQEYRFYKNLVSPKDVEIDKIVLKIVPFDVCINMPLFPYGHESYKMPELQNPEEIISYVKQNIEDIVSIYQLAESPLFDVELDLSTKNDIFNGSLIKDIRQLIKLSPAEYKGTKIDLPHRLCLTILFK